MATRADGYTPLVLEDILVRVVEADYVAMPASYRLATDAYAPSFNLWDGAPVLDLLLKAADAPKQKGRPAPVLLLNLLVPKEDSSQRLL
jgi:hypothetical protein